MRSFKEDMRMMKNNRDVPWENKTKTVNVRCSQLQLEVLMELKGLAEEALDQRVSISWIVLKLLEFGTYRFEQEYGDLVEIRKRLKYKVVDKGA